MSTQQMTQLQALVAKWRSDADAWEDDDERHGRSVAGHLRDCADELAAALSPEAGAGETAVCPKCGAPCKRTVNIRGGDWGWSTTDEERAVYRYAHPAQGWQAHLHRMRNQKWFDDWHGLPETREESYIQGYNAALDELKSAAGL
jgi:hypothetical protein